jgi:uroporphyrin-III C-methyltransferase/precorrin-2 dehydrogenase/sirohydrochlorin ferrochelatase
MPRTQSEHRCVAYFAAFLDLLGKKVVVVGGGRVASSKVRALLPCQPAPLMVRDLNAQVAADARALGIPVLAVDDVPNCDFIAPALVRRGDLTIAISTSGKSPAMARRTREHLERALPAFWGDLLDVAAAARERLGAARALVEPDAWQVALDQVQDLVSRGVLPEAEAALVHKLEHSLFEPIGPSGTGLVSLVGAGPGDPDLLTLRAVDRLQHADVVVHDRLAGERVLEYAGTDAERIDVGKRPGGLGASQDEINALLIELGGQGKRVVRLKGGDPFVFGRGGEEALALAKAGVAFEVVPGVSSALAAPAAAGIPVTHRGLSASVTVINGHDVDQHDWDVLSRAGGTLVLLMAVERLDDIAARLLESGKPATEPTALIEWATTPRQRIILAPLRHLVATARAEGVQAPAVLVVGPTAALARELGATESALLAEVTRG